MYVPLLFFRAMKRTPSVRVPDRNECSIGNGVLADCRCNSSNLLLPATFIGDCRGQNISKIFRGFLVGKYWNRSGSYRRTAQRIVKLLLDNPESIVRDALDASRGSTRTQA
jgi:hypothetical protein